MRWNDTQKFRGEMLMHTVARSRPLNRRAIKYTAMLLSFLGTTAMISAPARAQADPSTVASVCTGVSLPPSVVTGIMAPVLTGIVSPTETAVNDALDVIAVIPMVGTTITPL